jgi:hypothetical protein
MRIGGIIALVGLAAALVVSGASAFNIVTDVSLPKAEVNSPYDFQFEVVEGCGPYQFSLVGGTLPPGFRLQGDGRLLGLPETAGTFTFTLAAVDLSKNCPSEPSRGTFVLDVLPDLAITAETLPAARIGVPYSAAVPVAGRDATAVRWAIVEGALPAGLRLLPNGTVAGTPTTAGGAGFVLKVEEPFRRQDVKYMTLAVTSALAVSPLPEQVGEVEHPLAAVLAQTGGIAPVRWEVVEGSLPFGLRLDPATGRITGRPHAAGRFGLAVQATDASGTTARVSLALTVAPRLEIRTARLGPARVGARYDVRLRTAGGVGRARWTVARGTLPQGLRLASGGTLTGRPRSAGTFRLTLRARDALGVVATRRVALLVRP